MDSRPVGLQLSMLIGALQPSEFIGGPAFSGAVAVGRRSRMRLSESDPSRLRAVGTFTVCKHASSGEVGASGKELRIHPIAHGGR